MMQKFIGMVMYGLAGGFVARAVHFDMQIIACLIIMGVGGVIYGDAE